jgi:hypothetical protein
MTERPILFSGSMVRALLNGSKTQTRRVAKYAPEASGALLRRCPYGAPGDRLWVRETWTWNGGMCSTLPHFDELYVTYAADGARRSIKPGGPVETPKQPPGREGEAYWKSLTRWWRRKIPAIHMYRWASRITLEITKVRIERLQDISEADALAEGISTISFTGPDAGPNLFTARVGNGQFNAPTASEAYRMLWESISGPGSWDANPWVWVVSFKPTN